MAFCVNLKTKLFRKSFSQSREVEMGHHRLFYYSPKIVTLQLNTAVQLAEEIQAKELELIHQLHEIDELKFYVRYGYNSLTGFCNHGLKFSRTQTQRIVTQVRRLRTT